MQRITVIILLCLVSCSKLMDKPKDLLSQDKMAEIIAEFAIADQSFNIDTNITQQESTKHILKTYKIKGQTFSDSYQYYLSNGSELEVIFDKAQKLILKKDPKLESYIKKKSQEKPNGPEPKTK